MSKNFVVKKIILVIVLGFLGVSGFLFSGNPAEAACTNVDVSLYYQNEATNEMTFRITGTPGNEIQFVLDEPYNNYKNIYTDYFYLPSSGVMYITKSFNPGSYRAYVYQYYPCSSWDEAYFNFVD